MSKKSFQFPKNKKWSDPWLDPWSPKSRSSQDYRGHFENLTDFGRQENFQKKKFKMTLVSDTKNAVTGECEHINKKGFILDG